MHPIVFTVLLAIYSLLLTAALIVLINTYSLPAFRRVRIEYKEHLACIIAFTVLIAAAFLTDLLYGYRARIAVLIICLCPLVFTQLTFRAKTMCADPDNDDYFKIKSRRRLIERIATSAYIIYIPLTLTYLQLI